MIEETHRLGLPPGKTKRGKVQGAKREAGGPQEAGGEGAGGGRRLR